MSYWGIGVMVFLLLVFISGGWYFLFKRFERRISSRFDDLVARSDETLKSFSDTFEIITVRARELHEHVQKVKLDCEKTLYELELVDRKLDLLQGIQLVIKQDGFLEHARAILSKSLEKGTISRTDFEKMEKLVDEMKLDNYSRF